MGGNGAVPADRGFAAFEQLVEHWSRREFLRRLGGAASVGVIGMGGLLEACGGQTTQQDAGGKPQKGGHVTEGWPLENKTFNSTLQTDVYSSLLIGLTFDGLLTAKADGGLVPMLATEIPRASGDGTTYTFKLSKNATWSDGKPVTSEDVAFTYNLMFAPQYAAVNSPRRGDLSTHLQSITTPDPHTVVFKTKGVYAPFLTSHAQYGILPKHVLGGLSPEAINSAPFNTNPTVTSGLFKFERWDKGSQVVLRRNESYHRGPAHLDRFVFKVLSQTTAVLNQLKTGEIDMGPIDQSQVDEARAIPGIELVSFPIPNYTYMGYQLDPSKPGSQIFGDKRVRQALIHALDRPSMVKAIYFNQATVANSVEPATSWAYDSGLANRYPFDPKKASKLLDDAGWVKGQDGIRVKDRRRLAFTLVTLGGVKADESVVQVMQQRWKEIGVAMTPKPVTLSALTTIADATRDFDAFMVGFNFGADPDQTLLYSSQATSPGGFNGMMFRNAEVDRLLDQATKTLDRGRRKELYAQYQRIMAEEVPVAVLFGGKGNYAINKRVKGYGLGTFSRYGGRPWMKDVWVTDGK
jgi:peptide/nickel transport system substrate-binding protein